MEGRTERSEQLPDDRASTSGPRRVLVTGACSIPVLFIQHRVARRARELTTDNQSVSEDVHRLMRYWYGLGWPAFIAMLGIFHLMVFNPVLA
jgi:uncharacterized membrane protein